MAKAIVMFQGLSQKMSRKEPECRTLQVNMPPPRSVDIEFTDITLKISEGLITRKEKTILKGLSGLFKSGHLTAIMGPSGAGKSSLMNALTGFSTQGVTGKIRAGDSVCELKTKANSLSSLKAYRKKSVYILQDDRLNPLFTVAELMKFAADMKLGNSLTEKLKLSVISEILTTLALGGTEDTRCANLSGGQRKRLSIALELIDNPPVLFLDEPTTGLDSLTSMQCMTMLKSLAREGRTIVCTIHQPPASIYTLCDHVYVLAEGMCIYNGASENTVSHLASLGFQCPIYHNPADYIIELAHGDYGKHNELLAEKCSRPDPTEQRGKSPVSAEKEAFSCGRMSVMINKPDELYRFNVLFRRCLIQQYRDWTVTQLKILIHLVIGILLGLLFERAGSDGSKTVNNLGFLIVSCAYLCYTSLMPAVLKFPSELLVLKKENFNNWYNLKTYYAAVLVSNVPLQILFSIVYSTPAYFLTGQPMELSRYTMFVLALATVTLWADGLGNVIGTCVNPINGTFFGAIATCAMIVFAGFLVLLSHMTPFMRSVANVSFIKFTFEALVLSVYAYGRQPLPCPENKDYCHTRHPKEIMNLFSLKPDNYWFSIMVVAVEIIILRLIAYFTLRRHVKKST